MCAPARPPGGLGMTVTLTVATGFIATLQVGVSL
jgi:hypothetical protein